jgi:hypothetical protein
MKDKSPPKPITQAEFIKKFKARYAYVYDLMHKTEPDLLRWVYDNLVKQQ